MKSTKSLGPGIVVAAISCVLGLATSAQAVVSGQAITEQQWASSAILGTTPLASTVVVKVGRNGCGGTYIAPGKVLTAAHCVVDTATGEPRVPQDMRVRGRSLLTNAFGVVSSVQGAHVHPAYNPNTLDHDLAVLTLLWELPGVPTAPLSPPDTIYPDHTRAVVAGWGNDDTDLPSVELRQVKLETLSNDACAQAYNYRYAVTPAMLCAGSPNAVARGVGRGDSGGPLFIDNALAGVVSWAVSTPIPSRGYVVSGEPSVFVRLGKDIQKWIASIPVEL